MTETKDLLLDQIRERLSKVFKPQKIFLWGSRASGTHSVDSDYDIIVVVDHSDVNMRERNLKAREAMWGISASVDVFVFTQQEFDLQKEQFDSIPERVMTEGRELDIV
ncbi:MAG: nucleotidyltransferase domain-containing protein [Oligoflexia bacterium]|nr:nucleotidyltransferase domain-containing protein [Oligoflexia bacterium]